VKFEGHSPRGAPVFKRLGKVAAIPLTIISILTQPDNPEDDKTLGYFVDAVTETII
jgi:hypothetical protein